MGASVGDVRAGDGGGLATAVAIVILGVCYIMPYLADVLYGLP